MGPARCGWKHALRAARLQSGAHSCVWGVLRRVACRRRNRLVPRRIRANHRPSAFYIASDLVHARLSLANASPRVSSVRGPMCGANFGLRTLFGGLTDRPDLGIRPDMARWPHVPPPGSRCATATPCEPIQPTLGHISPSAPPLVFHSGRAGYCPLHLAVATTHLCDQTLQRSECSSPQAPAPERCTGCRGSLHKRPPCRWCAAAVRDITAET